MLVLASRSPGHSLQTLADLLQWTFCEVLKPVCRVSHWSVRVSSSSVDM
ncbi:MAG: hypothetical protein ACK55Z_08000 [bacterium]